MEVTNLTTKLEAAGVKSVRRDANTTVLRVELEAMDAHAMHDAFRLPGDTVPDAVRVPGTVGE